VFAVLVYVCQDNHTSEQKAQPQVAADIQIDDNVITNELGAEIEDCQMAIESQKEMSGIVPRNCYFNTCQRIDNDNFYFTDEKQYLALTDIHWYGLGPIHQWIKA